MEYGGELFGCACDDGGIETEEEATEGADCGGLDEVTIQEDLQCGPVGAKTGCLNL